MKREEQQDWDDGGAAGERTSMSVREWTSATLGWPLALAVHLDSLEQGQARSRVVGRLPGQGELRYLVYVLGPKRRWGRNMKAPHSLLQGAAQTPGPSTGPSTGPVPG